MEIKKNVPTENQLLSFIEKKDEIIAITQMDCEDNINAAFFPQISCLKRLFVEYPGAVFIYNYRDTKKIIDSMQRWFNMDNRIYEFCPELFSSKSGNISEDLENLINNHFNDVKNFFENKPFSRFCIVDIEDNCNIDDFPGISFANFSLPHANKNKGVKNKYHKFNKK